MKKKDLPLTNSSSGDSDIHIEVVYAQPEDQTVHQVRLAEGATVHDALRVSGLLDKAYPDQALNVVPDVTAVGIYGERVAWDDVLMDGDRVEVYRPLVIDPMEARRARAKKQQEKIKPTQNQR